MARARLEYDDSGSTFFYFLISFYLLILLPITYYLWPRKTNDKRGKGLVCHCDPCLNKKAWLDREKPNETYKQILKAVVLILLWSLLVLMMYRVLNVETEFEEYDPFEILQIDPSATTSEIKKQYRRLSKVYHPDKQGGNQDMFMKIAKAYEALTDEVSKENWEKYGNPDGPQTATFGIALPAWIIEKQNSVWVLVVYMSIFAIVLPLLVGVWWYRSIQYGSTNVLLQTSQIFLYFMARSKSITPRRVMMILTSAFEFNPEKSPLVKYRPSDDLELSEIIRSKAVPHIDIKTKENPFCAQYAAKARILMHAHLERLLLRPDTLQIDQRAMLQKSPQLIQEMISALIKYWFHCKQRQIQAPCVDVFECVISVSQMVVQGMWGRGTSPILQLPNVKADQLKHFKTRKRKINSLEEFAAMKEEDRRLLVRALSDEEYINVMAVCAMFPHVDITVDVHVVDDIDSKRVTAGSVVTVTVNITRTGLLDYYKVDIDNILSDTPTSLLPLDQIGSDDVPGDVEVIRPLVVESESAPDGLIKSETKTTAGWEKNRKTKKGKMAAKKKVGNPKKNKKKQKSTSKPELSKSDNHGKDESEEDEDKELKDSGDDHSGSSEDEGADEAAEGALEADEEEDEWKRLQKTMKKQKALQEARKESHPVHAPLFPAEKQECWWLFLVDRRKREVISPPQKITGLQDTLSIDLQFAASPHPGTVKFTVVLTSDSYLDLSFQQELKILIHERVEVNAEKQWKELEEEEQEEEVIEESDTDSDLLSSSEYEEED